MRRYMTWTGVKSDRAYNELMEYGEKFYMVSLFDFHTEYVNGTNTTGKIVGDITEREWEVIEKWEHIKWYLCIRNDGYAPAFQDLLDNRNGAQDIFISEIRRLIDKYPFISGIDIDLERGGGMENTAKAVNLFRRISEVVRGAGKLLHVDLPGMTGEGESIGGERWCDYKQLAPLFDSCTIMTYGWSWAGSAPGPISQRKWLEDVYNYAVTVIPPEKIFMGVAGYGFRWQIYKPTDGWRGTSWSYLAAEEWIYGRDKHSENQPNIPWVSYWDDENKCPYMFLHIYDLQKAAEDNVQLDAPLQKGSYGGESFVTAYQKIQKVEFIDIMVDKDAIDYNSSGGALQIEDDYIAARIPAEGENHGWASYSFTISETGIYKIILQVNYPWWDSSKIGMKLDGVPYEVKQPNQWYPLARRVHWVEMAEISLNAGTHTLEFIGSNSDVGTGFYGFKICKDFHDKFDAGQGEWNIVPQTYIDVNGNEVQAEKFRLTFEVIRRPPEYALVWSDDFRSYAPAPYESWKEGLFKAYYNVNGGNWIVEGQEGLPSILKQTNNNIANAECMLKYNNFEDLHIEATFKHSGQEAGIIFGNNKVGINGNTLVLYKNGIKSHVEPIIRRANYNTLRVRVRNGNCRIWLNNRTIIQTTTGGSYRFGLYTQYATIDCSLLQSGDAYWMYPQESITLISDAGEEQLGRIERESVLWDDKWGMFKLTEDVEEIDTRINQEDISMDWVYLHSSILDSREKYNIKIKQDDIGIWIGKLYLCDADGSSIAYYNDSNSYQYWANRAEFDWNLQGIGMWTLGLQGPKIYKYIPRQF